MAWYNFLTRNVKPEPQIPRDDDLDRKKVLTVQEFMEELGLSRSGVIGSYDDEENPDDLGPETYISMQQNDGEIQAIVRLLSLPIQSTPITIIPGKNDKGEKEFIETVFMGPEYMGGMTTPLQFIVADMTRAIFEGFRLYEKVAHIIKDGPYSGKIGWRKLAPRDVSTISLRADEHGGFNGAHQSCSFGKRTVDVNIPPDKCILYTFQKEKHWLYGESILKAAYYHYDKKHKLYYIAHKKAEIEALGLKILKINQNLTSAERTAAENTVDTIGVNSRITLPQGLELEINRATGGFDVLPLISHHNDQMSISALTQIVSQVKYAYPYGKGTEQSKYLGMAIHSIMRQMETTLNTYAVAPLIDWNFASQSYPQIKLENLTDEVQILLARVFDKILSRKEIEIPSDFIEEVTKKIGKKMELEWSEKKPVIKKLDTEEPKIDEPKDEPKDKLKEEPKEKPKNNDVKIKEEKKKEKKITKALDALDAFEKGKIQASNALGISAPVTPMEIKKQILKLDDSPKTIKNCFDIGYQYIYEKFKRGKN